MSTGALIFTCLPSNASMCPGKFHLLQNPSSIAFHGICKKNVVVNKVQN
jgi:hypothetical protein